jgi:hypothetical protein
MKLSRDQARTLAQDFLEIANELSDFRVENFETLSTSRRLELNRLEGRVRHAANDFLDLAINLAVGDLDAQLEEIAGATKRGKEALDRINDVRKAIGIATAFVKLGAAIVTGNPGAIAGAIVEVGSSVT